jgi:hypothetical protein
MGRTRSLETRNDYRILVGRLEVFKAIKIVGKKPYGKLRKMEFGETGFEDV